MQYYFFQLMARSYLLPKELGIENPLMLHIFHDNKMTAKECDKRFLYFSFSPQTKMQGLYD